MLRWFLGSVYASRVTTGRRRILEQRLFIEVLETRVVLSADGLDQMVATPQLTITPAVTNNTISGYTPTQIRHAYGFDQVTFGSVIGNGAGQTIAIVDAYGDPNIANDLHVFDLAFGLPDPTFTKVSQTGNTKYPATNAGWALETALDVEWAHAIAPAAKILLVEANTSSLSNLLTAVDYARKQAGVSVVSMSWGSNEFSSEASYDSHFTTPNGHAPVTFVASSGDTGALPIWPAVSTNVLSVGGTSLYLNSDNTWQSESAWSGSGGGYSAYEKEATWQTGVQTSGKRSSPDVAYDANPNTGFAVYDSVSYNNQSGWFQVGGTSAGAPQWAALVAIADQGRALSGLSTLGKTQMDVYSLAKSDFHDITTGSSSSSYGSFAAKAGYDLVTGIGTPSAGSTGNLVIQQLISASVTVNSTTSSSGGGGSTTVTLLFANGNDLNLDWDTSPLALAATAPVTVAQGASVANAASTPSAAEPAAEADAHSMTLRATLPTQALSRNDLFAAYASQPQSFAIGQPTKFATVRSQRLSSDAGLPSLTETSIVATIESNPSSNDAGSVENPSV